MIEDTVTYDNDTDTIKARPEPLLDLFDTGCAVPDPVHVTYNLGTKNVYKMKSDGSYELDENGKRIKLRDYPCLTTIVNWATGEKTVVENSEADGLVLNSDGTASIFSKECGFVFALAKRILAGKISRYDGELTYSERGFGAKLASFVKNATDQQELEKQRKINKELSKKRRQESEAKHAAKLNVQEPSLRKCVKDLSEIIARLNSNVCELIKNK